MLAAGALVLAVTYAAVLLAAVAGARQRAAAAADLAALAGAGSAPGDRCAVAARAAASNGARLDRCAATAAGVLVRASVPLPGPLAAFGARTTGASARAGPVEQPGS